MGREGSKPCFLSAGRVFSGSGEAEEEVGGGAHPVGAGAALGMFLTRGYSRGDEWSWLSHASFPSIPSKQPLPHLPAPSPNPDRPQ